MAVLQTYQTLVNREDLSDYMRLVDPESNWGLKNFKTDKAKARYVEWTLDEIATPTAHTTKVEGFTVSHGTLTQPTRAGNWCEIASEDGQISRTQEQVDTAGQPQGTLAYQVRKQMKLLKKKMEYSIIINASATSGASGTARKTKGVLGWITTNTSSATATGIDLSEALFNDNLQAIWTACGDPEGVIHTLCGAFNKRKFSDFTGVSSSAITIPAEKNKVVSAITVIESDFGMVNIHKHHVLNANSAGTVINLYDPQAFAISYLQMPVKGDLGATGDNYRFYLVTEYALKSFQQKKAGKIINTATS